MEPSYDTGRPGLPRLDSNTEIQFTGSMKATIEVPDALYRQVKAKSALEGRAIREVAVELFESYVGAGPSKPKEPSPPSTLDGEPLPSWFGALGKYTRQAKRHDMESVRHSIAAGLAKDLGL